ncbi:MAG: hypothetical protein ABSD96_03035 [Candidatus Korobacteraceae bacterium]|jgi:hypothetical protein
MNRRRLDSAEYHDRHPDVSHTITLTVPTSEAVSTIANTINFVATAN